MKADPCLKRLRTRKRRKGRATAKVSKQYETQSEPIDKLLLARYGSLNRSAVNALGCLLNLLKRLTRHRRKAYTKKDWSKLAKSLRLDKPLSGKEQNTPGSMYRLDLLTPKLLEEAPHRVCAVLTYILEALEQRDASVFADIARLIERTPRNEPILDCVDLPAAMLFSETIRTAGFDTKEHSFAELQSIAKAPSRRTIARLAKAAKLRIKERGRPKKPKLGA